MLCVAGTIRAMACDHRWVPVEIHKIIHAFWVSHTLRIPFCDKEAQFEQSPTAAMSFIHDVTLKDVAAAVRLHLCDGQEAWPISVEIHLWAHFCAIKDIYTSSRRRCRVTKQDLASQLPPDRWVEIPRDSLQTPLSTLPSDLALAVETRNGDGSWPRTKAYSGDGDWLQQIECGDIIDVQDREGASV